MAKKAPAPEPAPPKEPVMMRGSEGRLDYVAFARRGGFVLGVKPNVITDGRVKDTTYIGARLRSAPAGQMFAEEDKASKVASIGDAKLTTASAWPEVTWEKQDDKRASTQIGMFVRGTPNKNPELLLEQLKDGKLGQQMAEYLAKIAGQAQLIMPEAELAEWVNRFYAPIAEKIRDRVEKGRQVDEEIEGSLGVFGMQAALMKKVYDGHKQQSGPGHEAEDLDEVPDFGDDEDPDHQEE